MKFQDLVAAARFRIVEGSPFLWKCYGPDARTIDFGDDSSDIGVSCVFDTRTLEVYEVSLYPSSGKDMRWISPAHIDSVKAEFDSRGLNFSKLDDDGGEEWIELDHVADVLRKTSQIIEDGDCDDFMSVDLNLEDETLLKLSLMAHERDMTLNAFINEILRESLLKD